VAVRLTWAAWAAWTSEFGRLSSNAEGAVPIRRGRPFVCRRTVARMTDPATLRAQAEQLRRVSRAIRGNAAALDDELGTLQRRYPLRSGGVWEGPYADRYAEGVSDARGDLAALSRSVDGYAHDCGAKATQLDAQAGDLEEERHSEHEGAR
jgi:hypothetical protein